MNIQIVPVTQQHAEDYHACLDAVACERRRFGFVDGCADMMLFAPAAR